MTGRALPGVSISIADPDHDGIGEIVVATPARFAGYIGEAPSEGPIRTGDLGRLDDTGRLTVVDRRTDRIVRGGENVSPAEVEALLTSLPWIEDAAVVADGVNRLLADGGALPQLVRHDGWDWHLHATTPDAPLATRMAVEAAMALLDVVRARELERLKTCDADDCADAHVDLSRNRSRRYCGTRCGNRADAAAYRARKAAGE